MSIQDAICDEEIKNISSTLSSFCIKASELSQAKDEEDEEKEEIPTLTYDEIKGLLNKLGSSGEEMYKLRKTILSHMD